MHAQPEKELDTRRDFSLLYPCHVIDIVSRFNGFGPLARRQVDFREKKTSLEYAQVKESSEP